MILPYSLVVTLLTLAFIWRAWTRTRDALHPVCYMGPMFVYVYAYRPLVLDLMGFADELFTPAQLLWVLTINLAGLVCFFVGLVWHDREAMRSAGDMQQGGLSPSGRARAATLGTLLGVMAVMGFLVGIMGAGGLTGAYGQAKGGGFVTSGYIGEAPMLAFPAIGLLALAWQNTRLTADRMFALLVFAAPFLIHGILGARRGPTFMIFMALLFAVYTIAGRRPKLAVVVPAIAVLGLLTVWLVNNRGRIYIGTDWAPTEQASLVYRQGRDIGSGDDWAYGAGVMLTSREFGTHYWGWRYLGHVLVQPIPRQLWPDKYHAIGLGWLSDQGYSMGMTTNEWARAVGWVPAGGSACGIVADFFAEFGYLGVVACFGFGWLYGYLWKRSAYEGGVWRAIYLFAVILSIYVPTQNFNAWYYRFLIMSIPTAVVWRLYLSERRQAIAAMHAPRRVAPRPA
jgi:hypothetical protein